MTPSRLTRSALDAVYRATTYQADWPVSFWREGNGVTIIRLRVGAASPELDDWLGAVGAVSWAYLTAANPRSEKLPEVDNVRRTAALSARLVVLGLPFLAGHSLADDGQWPAEESFLVAGIEEGAACRLAEEFGQNAFLSGSVGEPGRLCWTPLAPESG